MEIRKMVTTRDEEDYRDLQDIISEVYEECGHEEFMFGSSVVDLADDVLGIINKSSDYRYLRLFNNHEIENEIQSYKDDMEHVEQLRKEG
jgi:hypothetical protein